MGWQGYWQNKRDSSFSLRKNFCLSKVNNYFRITIDFTVVEMKRHGSVCIVQKQWVPVTLIIMTSQQMRMISTWVTGSTEPM